MNNRQSLLSRIDKRWLGAGIAAAGSVAATQATEAAIVYSGPVNINIPSTTAGVYLNVVTGVNNPSPGLVPGWDVNPWSSTSLNMFTPTPAPAGGGAHVGTGTTYNNLAFGTLVGPASTYGSTGTNTINGATPLNLNSSNNCVGFRFINEANGGAIHYGSMQISLSGSAFSQPRAIVGYWYESTAGVAAPACTPEPTSIALLAMGALGLTARRRRTA